MNARAAMLAGPAAAKPAIGRHDDLVVHFSEQAALARALRATAQQEAERSQQECSALRAQLADLQQQLNTATAQANAARVQQAAAEGELKADRAKPAAKPFVAPPDNGLAEKLRLESVARARAETERDALKAELAKLQTLKKPPPKPAPAPTISARNIRVVVRERDGNGQLAVADVRIE